MDVEDPPAWDNRLLDVAQDVHDVLRLHSSERPAEQREVELPSWEFDLDAVRDHEFDALPQVVRGLFPCENDRVFVGIETEDARALARTREREPALPAADVDDLEATQVDELTNRRELDSVGIDHGRHRR
jgi:hypothetical protein